MKKHFNAIITKFLFVAPVMGIVGMIFSGMNYQMALIVAGIITLGAYLSADLVLLPRMGNRVALVGDAIITAVVYSEITVILGWAKFSLVGLLLLTLAIVFGEVYFHDYLMRTVLCRQQTNNKNTLLKAVVKDSKNRYETYKKSKRGKYK